MSEDATIAARSEGWSQQHWPWIVGALLVLFTHLSTTFMTTLGEADWQECFNSDRIRPRMLAVSGYWNIIGTYSGHYVWSIGSALPAMLALVWLRSRTVALVCLVMLGFLLLASAIDFGLMIGQFLRGEVATARHGLHQCDRKGTDIAQIMRLWLYLTAIVVTAVIPAVLLRRWWRGKASYAGQKASGRAV